MASSITAATTNLVALLEAATWPTPAPQIAFGIPNAFTESDIVLLLDIEEPDENAAALGAQARREETYVINVRIESFDPGAVEGRAVFLRAVAMRDVVRDVVRANSTLTGAVRECDVVGGAVSGGDRRAVLAQRTDQGWEAIATARILCKARIT